MSLHCCATMRDHVEYACDYHQNRYECGDCLIDYWSEPKRYGIMIHDGGDSMIVISYCPWCGTKLPDADKASGSRMIDMSGYSLADEDVDD